MFVELFWCPPVCVSDTMDAREKQIVCDTKTKFATAVD